MKTLLLRSLSSCSLAVLLAVSGLAVAAQAQESTPSNQPVPPTSKPSTAQPTESPKRESPKPEEPRPVPVPSNEPATPERGSGAQDRQIQRPVVPGPNPATVPAQIEPETLVVPDPSPSALASESASTHTSAASPSSSPSTTSAKPTPPSSAPTKNQVAPASVKNDSGSGPSLLTLLLVMAAVVVVAGGAIAVFALNRSRPTHR